MINNCTASSLVKTLCQFCTLHGDSATARASALLFTTKHSLGYGLQILLLTTVACRHRCISYATAQGAAHCMWLHNLACWLTCLTMMRAVLSLEGRKKGYLEQPPRKNECSKLRAQCSEQQACIQVFSVPPCMKGPEAQSTHHARQHDCNKTLLAGVPPRQRETNFNNASP